eukprot:5743123-Prymnesium_polylepis.2
MAPAPSTACGPASPGGGALCSGERGRSRSNDRGRLALRSPLRRDAHARAVPAAHAHGTEGHALGRMVVLPRVDRREVARHALDVAEIGRVDPPALSVLLCLLQRDCLRQPASRVDLPIVLPLPFVVRRLTGFEVQVVRLDVVVRVQLGDAERRPLVTGELARRLRLVLCCQSSPTSDRMAVARSSAVVVRPPAER